MKFFSFIFDLNLPEKLLFCVRMEDDNRMKEETSDDDWKVVSLMESSYATECGPVEHNSADGNDVKELVMQEREFSQSLFLSGHFVFPPSEHENLPVDRYELQSEVEVEVQQSNSFDSKSGESDKSQEDIWSLKGLSESSELHRVELLDKGKELFVQDRIIEEVKRLQSLNLTTGEQEMYNDHVFRSFHGNVDIDELASDNEEPEDISLQNLNFPSDFFKDSEPTKASKSNRLPSEAWWRKHAASLYAQAKETNAFWSFFVAAALMGLVILGQKWHQERYHIHQLIFKSSNHDMAIHRVIGPISRFKDVLTGASRRGFAGITSVEH